MKKGENAFFYHSNEDKAIVGVVEIIKTYYPDHTDESGKFGMVDVKAVKALKKPVTLAEIKAEPRLERHGARQQFATLGAAGDRRGMERHSRDGRPLVRSGRRLLAPPFSAARFRLAAGDGVVSDIPFLIFSRIFGSSSGSGLKSRAWFHWNCASSLRPTRQ